MTRIGVSWLVIIALHYINHEKGCLYSQVSCVERPWSGSEDKKARKHQPHNPAELNVLNCSVSILKDVVSRDNQRHKNTVCSASPVISLLVTYSLCPMILPALAGIVIVSATVGFSV